jgi:Putative Flp pilus-assembly TadE/G-like
MKVHDTGSFRSRFGGEKGQVLILGSLSTMVLFSALGLAADLGYSYFTKMQLQTAADAAASAAAVYAYNGGTNSDNCVTLTCPVTYTCAGVTPATNAVQAGCLYAAADAPAGAAITLTESDNAHASSGMTGNNPGMWIKATVTASNHNLFLYWSGFHTASVLGQAVGGFSTISPGGCIYALSTTAPVGVSVTGSSSIATSGCGVNVASSSATALTVTGSSHVTASNGGQIVIHCALCTNITGTSSATPTPYVVAAVTDPLNPSLQPPAFSGCTHNLASGTSTETNYSVGNGSIAVRGPGVYCGGITVGGAATLTLNPGTYIMNGGGFNIGNSGTVNATGGVFIYNTATSGHTAGSVSIQGSATVNLVAPNSGPYQGIAFFQDRSLQNAATIANSGSGNITGTYYFPDAPFSFTGNTQSAVTAAFIASTVTVSGSSSLTNDTTGKLTGLAKTTVGVMQ